MDVYLHYYVTVSVIFAKMSPQESTISRFWLPHHPWLFSRLLCWGRDSYPGRLSLKTPHWIIHLIWRRIPLVEYFELKTFDLFWHFVKFVIQSDGLWSHIYSQFDRSDSSANHLLRLMESLSNPSCGLRIVATCYTGAYLSLIISLHFQLDIQSHHVYFPFDIQSHIFILEFRVAFSVSAFGSVICL